MRKRARTKWGWKNQPKVTTHPISNWREERSENNVLFPWMPDETFIEEIVEWIDSPEGQHWAEVSDTLEDLLKDVDLDVKQRKFIWPDAKRLDLDQSIRCIKKRYPNLPRNKIEEFLIEWIEMSYATESYSEAQMNEVEKLAERWIAAHFRQTKNSKRGKTRHS